MGTRPALPARRWPEILPGLPVAAQLIIGGAFFRIAQHLVSFGNRFEMLLGLRLLADVRVILASQPAVDFLDVFRRGVAGEAEDLVIVLVFHTGSAQSGVGPTG